MDGFSFDVGFGEPRYYFELEIRKVNQAKQSELEDGKQEYKQNGDEDN